MESDFLSKCPFCGAGLTQIIENGKMWTGMKYSDPVSISIKHWCEAEASQPTSFIELKGRDLASAIRKWETRK